MAAGAAVCLVLAAWGFARFHPQELGPKQPIPFSHRVHAGEKRIGCLMCHPGVLRGYRADIPPLETCMLCHERIIIHFPPIHDLREHYYGGKPVIWKRVNWVPEFVYFDHAVHIHRAIDCARCHGDVEKMDRVVKAREFEMGFCIQCHRDNNATHDCFVCHR